MNASGGLYSQMRRLGRSNSCNFAVATPQGTGTEGASRDHTYEVWAQWYGGLRKDLQSGNKDAERTDENEIGRDAEAVT